MARNEIAASDWVVLGIVVAMLVAALALAAFGAPPPPTLTVYSAPLPDARLPTKTAWPPGERLGFAVRFQRLRDRGCPTSFVWHWGGGERSTSAPVTPDQTERCREGLVVEVATPHVLSHPLVPRRVLVDALGDAGVLERMCFNWPARTPCESGGVK